MVDAFARYRIQDPLRFYQTRRHDRRAPIRSSRSCSTRRCAACSARRRFTHVVRDERAELMARMREQLDKRGAGLRHLRWSTCVSAAPICRSRTARRSISACRPSGSARRPSSAPRAASARRKSAPRADRDVTVLVAEATVASREQIRGEGDGERNRIFAEAFGKDPDFFAFYRSMQAYEAGHAAQRHPHGADAGFGVLPLFRRSVGQAARTRRRRRAGTPPVAGRRRDNGAAAAADSGWRACPIFWSRSAWCLPSRACCSPRSRGREAGDGARHSRRPTRRCGWSGSARP